VYVSPLSVKFVSVSVAVSAPEMSTVMFASGSSLPNETVTFWARGSTP